MIECKWKGFGEEFATGEDAAILEALRRGAEWWGRNRFLICWTLRRDAAPLERRALELVKIHNIPSNREG